MIELRDGALRLVLCPELGGSVAGLWHEATPVLRSAEGSGLGGPRQGAAFPMLPYSNRLAYRRFRWQGKEYTTAPNFDDNPHSLHGVAWLRAWQVEQVTTSSAELVYRHEPDAHWPFAFEARQHFALADGALALNLAVKNTGALPQPLGLGWHPYFPKRSRSRLHAEVKERWESDATQLPTRKLSQDSIDGDVAPMAFDHCFEGWSGAARLRDERLSLRLSSSLGRLVVYTPQQRDYFCVEPVSHVSNAIHMADPLAHGLKAAAPGEGIDAWIRLEAAPI